MAEHCLTNWVAPNRGATVSEIAALIGETIDDERPTSLAIVETGEVTPYDTHRAIEALRQMHV